MVIVINRHVIARNRKTGAREPPIAVKPSRSGRSSYVTEWVSPGSVRLIYDPDHPLPCGATVWLETI